MRIGFILGAGVSTPACMRKTDELTEEVFRLDNYTRHNQTFVRARPEILGDPSWNAERDPLRSFLEFVRGHCQMYFDTEKLNRRTVNYEDLYFAASQLHDHLGEEYENPAMEPFARSVLDGQVNLEGREHLKKLSGLACAYIQGVVTSELARIPYKGMPDHLVCLGDAVNDARCNGCDVFTLNHDCLIETNLRDKGVTLVDGFGPQDGDVAWWSPEVFSDEARSYFIKLHGSVNWRRHAGRLAKHFTYDPDNARTANGRRVPNPESSARMLLGTFNKIRDYFTEPYFDLMATFRRQMKIIDTVIISGYSFGDKGLNAVLSEWMWAVARHKILILHADGERCIFDGRGAIRILWHKFGGSRMRIHSRHLNVCDWRELVNQYRLYEFDSE